MVPPVGGNNFGIIPTIRLVSQACLSNIYMSAVFTMPGINRVSPLLPSVHNP